VTAKFLGGAGALVGILAGVVVSALWHYARERGPRARWESARAHVPVHELRVPRGAPWHEALRIPFGERPHSEARFVWEEKKIRVLLYAADEDIRSSDSFHVEIAGRAYDLAPEDDIDGTIDDPTDDDEEWTREIEVPFDAAPGARVTFALHRCDTPKNGQERCADRKGALVLSD